MKRMMKKALIVSLIAGSFSGALFAGESQRQGIEINFFKRPLFTRASFPVAKDIRPGFIYLGLLQKPEFW